MYPNQSSDFELTRLFHHGHGGAILTQGPDGPGLTYELTQIHDHKDPLGEARSWLHQNPANQTSTESPGLAVVFGLGLGYHLKLLRQTYPDISLLVYEPIEEIVTLYENNNPLTEAEGATPIIVTVWSDFEKAVQRELVYGPSSGIITVIPEPYKILRPEAFGTFSRHTHEQVIRRSVIDLTRKQTGQHFIHNLAQNAALLPYLPDLLLLKGHLPAIPAFIVGSGPSLDLSLDTLKQVSGRGLILASSSALKPLLAEGISPDVVLVLESEDTSDYLILSPEEQEISGPNTVLALASSCHPAHFKVPGYHKAVFHLTAGESQIFSNGAFLPQGGNSGTAAFALAFAWGLKPLVLVGQDQAYQGARLHARGTPGEVTGRDYGLLTVAGIGDTIVQTDTSLLASMSWFAESAKSIKANSSPPELYNASAKGAHLPGFIEISLQDLVPSLPPLESKLELANILPRIPKTTREEITKDVSQIAGMMGSLRKFARMNPSKALIEVKNICEMSKFCQQLLIPALAATTGREFNEALNRADGLMTTMLSSLR